MQTPQNTPDNPNLPPTAVNNIDPRIPRIVELRLQGQTWQQIANTIQRDRKTLYDIRQKEDFQNYINTILPIYNKSILELIQSPKDNIKLGATLEYGRMIRSGIPKEIHQTTDKREIKIVLHNFQPTPTQNQKNQENQEKE